MDYLKLFKESRGLTDTDFNNIINASCSYPVTKFKDEDKFILLLNKCRDKKILIIPDYDADGIMAGTICEAGLSLLGFNAGLYYPNTKYGYGLTTDSLREALSFNPGSEVLITCDNGISAHAGIAEAKRLGLLVLVTDHHPQQGILPAADACVDPSRDDDTYPFKGICGAQVIYHLLVSYASLASPEKLDDIFNLGVLAGIASIGDSMPMLEENRQLVRASLQFLDNMTPEFMTRYEAYAKPYQNAMDGIYSIKQKLQEENKYRAYDEDTYGFYICPILNAPRRVLGDSRLAFSVFEGDPSRVDTLYLINEERKQTTSSLFDIVKEKLDVVSPFYFRTTPVILGASGHAGLIAGRLTELTGKPSLCFSIKSDIISVPENLDEIAASSDIISGSGRAPSWYSITEFLSSWANAHPEAELKFGGHHQACGASIRADALSQFSSDFTRDIEEKYQIYVEDLPDEVIKEADINFSIGKNMIDDSVHLVTNEDIYALFSFTDSLKTMKPFGPGWPKPVFRFSLNLSQFYTQTIGKESQHIKLSSKTFPFDVLCWNMAKDFVRQPRGQVTVFGELSVEEFRGMKRLTLKANDVLFV